jgi:hypothetical protein
MSKSSSMIAFSVVTSAVCAMVAGSTSAAAQEGLFNLERNCAAGVSPLCAGHGWALTADTGTALPIAALIGAASTIAVTFLTSRRQPASIPAPGVTLSAWAVAWAGAIFLYLIAINYLGGAIILAINSNGADYDFGAVRVAFPILVGGVFAVASFWVTGRLRAKRFIEETATKAIGLVDVASAAAVGARALQTSVLPEATLAGAVTAQTQTST